MKAHFTKQLLFVHLVTIAGICDQMDKGRRVALECKSHYYIHKRLPSDPLCLSR